MASPIRVVFVDDTFTFGGAITSLGHLVNGLGGYDIDVTVISGQDIGVLDELFPGGRNYSIPLKLPWVHDDPFLEEARGTAAVEELGPATRVARSMYWFAVGDVGTGVRIARIARRHRPHIMHLNNGWQLDGALAAKVLRTHCVSHMRGMWTPAPPEEAPGLVRMARKAMHTLRYDMVPPEVTLPVSASVAANISGRGIPDDRITVVHDAIDLEAFHAGPAPAGLRAELGAPEDAVVVGHFGRVIPWKGTLEFIQGFAQVVKNDPDVHGLVVGDASDGSEEYEQSVHEAARELGITDRLTFTGFRSDVPDVMRACDIVVHSSIEPEPFGMVIVEGMATGNAVIAADAGGPLEIIRDGVDGFLVDPFDSEGMCDRIRTLATDSALRERIANAGIVRAREHFSKERYAADVVAVYERVLGFPVRRRQDVEGGS